MPHDESQFAAVWHAAAVRSWSSYERGEISFEEQRRRRSAMFCVNWKCLTRGPTSFSGVNCRSTKRTGRFFLAQADLGVAIGAGTDVAVEAADIVLVKNDPSDVARAIELAQKVRGKIKQNLFWAAVYNLLALPVAAGVLYPFTGFNYARNGQR